MTSRSKKTFRDLAQEGTRTVLAVFAIAVGIAGFASVLSTYAILTRELNRAYLATNPASATLRMDAIDDGLLGAVIANPAIADADARRVVYGQIKVGTDWHRLKLFVAKDFAHLRIAKLQPEQGAWPPSTGGLLIERDALGIAKVHIGDNVTVKTTGGTEQTLRISGSVHDVGQAQARMENIVYGYITLETLSRLGEAPYLDWLNIVVAKDRFDREHIRSVAAQIQKLAESRGHSVHQVDVPVPGEHPHAHIMGLLFSAMSGFGFCILALSGIVVVNLVAAIMASQLRQIGVMKAIGAARGQVALVYLSQALLLGTAAIIVALPFGVMGGRQLSSVMATLLNFDIASFAAPLWVYLLAAVAGWVVPLLAAAYPVWKGSRIPVRIALTEFGVSSSAFGSSGFDRVLAGVGGTVRPVLLALRNSFRRRARLALTLATLVAGGVFFVSGLNIRETFIRTLDRFFAVRSFDLTVNLTEMYPLETVLRAARNTTGVTRAEGWIVNDVTIPGTGSASQEEERFTLIALPPKSAFLRREIVEGRDLAAGDSDAIVVNTALAADNPQLAVGKRIALRLGSADVRLRIVGIARERLSPAVGYAVRDYVAQMSGHKGMTNSVRLALDRADPVSVNEAKSALNRYLEQEHVRAESITSKGETRFSFDQHMLMIYVFLVIVSMIIAAIGGLGLMTTMSLNVLERRREMGVLRAIGATPGMVSLIVVAEGLVVGLMSWLLAALVAWPVSFLLGEFLGRKVFTSGLDFQVDPNGFLIWLAVSIVVGVGGSLVPAWDSSRRTVREAVGHL